MNARPKMTSADLRRTANAVAQELQDARAEHAKHAYAHALDRNDAGARQTLIKSQQRMDLLQAELQGLSAATGEAERRERVAQLNAEIAQGETNLEEAIAAADKVDAIFGNVAQAIAALGVAYKELQDAELDSNRREAQIAKRSGAQILYSPTLHTAHYVDALLWLAIGHNHDLRRTETVEDRGQPAPNKPAEFVSKYCERAKDNMRHGSKIKLAALREEVAALSAPANRAA